MHDVRVQQTRLWARKGDGRGHIQTRASVTRSRRLSPPHILSRRTRREQPPSASAITSAKARILSNNRAAREDFDAAHVPTRYHLELTRLRQGARGRGHRGTRSRAGRRAQLPARCREPRSRAPQRGASKGSYFRSQITTSANSGLDQPSKVRAKCRISAPTISLRRLNRMK